MLSLKSLEGRGVGPYREHVSQDRISAFCTAVGARVDTQAPPTFFTVFRKGEFELFKELGIELARVLHAEQEYHLEGRVRAGDEVEFETTLVHVFEKQSKLGQMHFLTFETRFLVERELIMQSIGTAKTTIVVRDRKE